MLRCIFICLLMLSFSFISNNLLAFEALNIQFPSKDVTGKSVSTEKSLGNKPIYLKLWASWCVPCNQQMPHFVEAYEDYGDTIDFLSVNIDINDDKKAVATMIEKYAMTMPTIQDAGGKIAKAVGLVGTPLHVLIDKNGEVVHRGHKTDEVLSQRLKQLTKPASKLEAVAISDEQSNAPSVIQIPDKGNHAVYFSATWCDWYLAESRPAQSKNCIAGEHILNQLNQTFTTIQFESVVSFLWTTDKEVDEYREKYKIAHPVHLDVNNQNFTHFNINKLPTLVIFNDEKEVLRLMDFSNIEDVKRKVKQSLHVE